MSPRRGPLARSGLYKACLSANAGRSGSTAAEPLVSYRRKYRCVRHILMATVGAQNKDQSGCNTACFYSQSASLINRSGLQGGTSCHSG